MEWMAMQTHFQVQSGGGFVSRSDDAILDLQAVLRSGAAALGKKDLSVGGLVYELRARKGDGHNLAKRLRSLSRVRNRAAHPHVYDGFADEVLQLLSTSGVPRPTYWKVHEDTNKTDEVDTAVSEGLMPDVSDKCVGTVLEVSDKCVGTDEMLFDNLEQVGECQRNIADEEAKVAEYMVKLSWQLDTLKDLCKKSQDKHNDTICYLEAQLGDKVHEVSEWKKQMKPIKSLDAKFQGMHDR